MRSRVLLPVVLFLLATQSAFAIVGRDDVPADDYESLAALPQFSAAGLLRGGTTCQTAGGVLISPDWVLTAAHCVPASVSNQNVSFHFGSSASSLDTSVDAVDWFRQPGFVNATDGNDLALVRLASPILHVTPARLQRTSDELGQTVTVAGYGRTGTGLSGDTGAVGTRRAGTNMVDRIGATGFHPQTLLTDFDSPHSASESVWGDPAPLALESAIGLNDSGSPWFIEREGRSYVAGISSFRAARDGNANSDYRDISAAQRVSTLVDWIDANHDLTSFAQSHSARWHEVVSWDNGQVPSPTTTAVIDQGTIIVGAPAQARFVIAERTGTLRLEESLTTEHLIVRDGATLDIANQSTLESALSLENAITQLKISDASDSAPRLKVEGGNSVALGGALVIDADPSVMTNAPHVRGTVNDFVLLEGAEIAGQFDLVNFNGMILNDGSTYLGRNQNDTDGLFLVLDYDYQAPEGTDDPIENQQVAVRNYLALPGDANGDLIVDAQDFVIWSEFNNQTGTTWTQGDFNGNGITDGVDFTIWSRNEGRRAPITTPEPGGMVLLILAAMSFSLRRID